eukprot:CAMPEP_0114142774 /NCGR_PEP_ID=MMETSP0043_2-20121206/18626_1 /TAXON_ID=464988 /ORGANISM="Hemiselmis andersenii, Strain CCMP644" /LENGTH=592 /DNA_ID=CAMNT_0001237015 /DNA_START=181 /DNA_END=1956 /DNA_ORIENTATION=+
MASRATAETQDPGAKGSVWDQEKEENDDVQSFSEDSEDDADDLPRTAQEQLEDLVRKARRYLHNNREVSDFLWHTLYLALVSLVALSLDTGQHTLEQNMAVRSAMADASFTSSLGSQGSIQFANVQSVDDLWGWAQGPFAETVAGRGDAQGFFGRYLRVIGQVRFRQLRVQPNVGCVVPEYMDQYSTACYPGFSTTNEDVSAFGPVGELTGLPIWRWRTASELDEGWIVGKASGAYYAGSGFNFSMPTERVAAEEMLRFHRDNNWIDLQTRAVFVDFVSYNPNVRLLTLAKVIFELPPTGGAIPSITLRTSPLRMILPSESSTAMLAAEITLIVLTASYMIIDLHTAYRRGLTFLTDPWRLLDATNYLAYIVAFSLRLQPFYIMSARGFPPPPDAFVNYESAMWAVVQWKNVIALVALLSWIRLLKGIRLLRFMQIVTTTLGRAFLQVLPFCLVFVLLLWAFAIAHRLAFGDLVYSFRSVLMSMFTLQRVLLGADDFAVLWDANRLLGPLFYLGWTLASYLILANIFAAVLVEAMGSDALKSVPRVGAIDTAKGYYDRWADRRASAAEEARLAEQRRLEGEAKSLPAFVRGA